MGPKPAVVEQDQVKLQSIANIPALKSLENVLVLSKAHEPRPMVLSIRNMHSHRIKHIFTSFQYLCDRRLSDTRASFPQGKAVVAKVTEVDHDRKRFLVSLRMKDCYHGDTKIGMEFLGDYLHEYSMIQKTYAKQKGK